MDANCVVCSEEYNQDKKPVALTCGHTFCMTCINYILKNMEEKRKSCPKCREHITYYMVNYAAMSRSESMKSKVPK